MVGTALGDCKGDPVDETSHPAGGINVIQREFKGIRGHVVHLAMALISVLVIYWTVNVMADIVIKRSLYLMLTLVLGAVVYPFSRHRSSRVTSLVDALIVVLVIFTIASPAA